MVIIWLGLEKLFLELLQLLYQSFRVYSKKKSKYLTNAIEIFSLDGPVLKGGLLSIPSGTSDLPNFTNWIEACKKQNVEIFEGAYNNLPDENSEKAAKAVVDMVSNLDKEDVVIVLISGGGSALLSMTFPGLKLDDKLDVIKLLSRAGADIVELNTVR